MNWAPFTVAEPGMRPDSHRSISTPEGMGDRLRIAAFAEFQALHAFAWAIHHFKDASEELKKDWLSLIPEEQRHYDSIMGRMKDLGVDPGARNVSCQLWTSLESCKSAREFELFIANAEERGRKGALHFVEYFRTKDPTTAGIFRKIAEEEIAHVALAKKHYPDAPQPTA